MSVHARFVIDSFNDKWVVRAWKNLWKFLLKCGDKHGGRSKGNETCNVFQKKPQLLNQVKLFTADQPQLFTVNGICDSRKWIAFVYLFSIQLSSKKAKNSTPLRRGKKKLKLFGTLKQKCQNGSNNNDHKRINTILAGRVLVPGVVRLHLKHESKLPQAFDGIIGLKSALHGVIDSEDWHRWHCWLIANKRRLAISAWIIRW